MLCLSGNDPSGGAGLAADITAIQAQGCHACPVPTALTVQDTVNVQELIPVDPDCIERQAQAVLDDFQVSAFKIGICGSVQNVERIAALATANPDIPVITDPVVNASGGFALARDELIAALREQLIPLTSVLTPNHAELELLVPKATTPQEAARVLLDSGCEWVLVTQGDGNADPVTNLLMGADRSRFEFHWPRLDAQFHGSGCTLAAALAAQIALGNTVPDAAESAQAYTWGCLERAMCLGAGRTIPLR